MGSGPRDPLYWFGGPCWVVSARSTDQASLLRTARNLEILVPGAFIVTRPDVVIVAITVDSRKRAGGDEFDALLRCVGALISGPGVLSIGIAKGHCEELPTPVLQAGVEGRGVVRASRARGSAESLERVQPALATSHRVVVGADEPSARPGEIAADVAELLDALSLRLARRPAVVEIADSKQIDDKQLTSYVIPIDDVREAALATPLSAIAGVTSRRAVDGQPSNSLAWQERPLAFVVHADLIGSTRDLTRNAELPWYAAPFHRVLRKHLPALIEIAGRRTGIVARTTDLDSCLYFVSTGDGFHLCLYLDNFTIGSADISAPEVDKLKRDLLDWLATLILELQARSLRIRIAAALGPQPYVERPEASGDPWSTRTPRQFPGYPSHPHDWARTCIEGIERHPVLRECEVRCAGLDLEDCFRDAVMRGAQVAPSNKPKLWAALTFDDVSGRLHQAQPGGPNERRFGWYFVGDDRAYLARGMDHDPCRSRALGGFPVEMQNWLDQGRADLLFAASGPREAREAVETASTDSKQRAIFEAVLTSVVGGLLIATASAGDVSSGTSIRRIATALVSVPAAVLFAWWYGSWFSAMFKRVVWTHVGPTLRRFNFDAEYREPIQRMKIELLLSNDATVRRRLFGCHALFAARPDSAAEPNERAELRTSIVRLSSVVWLGVAAYGGFALVAGLAAGATRDELAWIVGLGIAAGLTWNAGLALRLFALSFERFSVYRRRRRMWWTQVCLWLADLVVVGGVAAHGMVAWLTSSRSHDRWPVVVAVLTIAVALIGAGWLWWRPGMGARGAQNTQGGRFVLDARRAAKRDAQEREDMIRVADDLLARCRNREHRAQAVLVVDRYGEVLPRRGVHRVQRMSEFLADGPVASKIVGDFVRYSRIPNGLTNGTGWLRFRVRCDADHLPGRDGDTPNGAIRIAQVDLETHALGEGRALPAGYVCLITGMSAPAEDELGERGYRHSSRNRDET